MSKKIGTTKGQDSGTKAQAKSIKQSKDAWDWKEWRSYDDLTILWWN